MASVVLGTINRNAYVDKSKLTSRFFPSKVGGKPAWLDLRYILEAEKMICTKCKIPLVFLCQLYAPIDEPGFQGQCFHRMLFVFFCNDCISDRTFLVLRSQLSIKNDYYSDAPPKVNDPEITSESWDVKLCKICGCKATVEYENMYCSLYHKKFDISSESTDKKIVILPEYEINEDVDDGSSENDDDESSNNDESSDEYCEDTNNSIGTLHDIENIDEALLEMAYSGDKDDVYFEKFKNTIASVPGQIIRYDRLGIPLWICSKCIPQSNEIPPCSYCGSERQFEFQIMPQILYYLKLPEIPAKESFNFGVLAIYTCPKSCNTNNKQYQEEFLWQQSAL
ncbi:programmed cell death protein 2 [Daktulosphaira vitifoliae]|uniref:programmed cell death protein 2 n=1 Tax=Daktulosphaira vitifoliae TaxID=58002 RepID=UPI0021A9AD48|nr:programmed cell death protein 2 [Daktulosphaira vitifoliae]